MREGGGELATELAWVPCSLFPLLGYGTDGIPAAPGDTVYVLFGSFPPSLGEGRLPSQEGWIVGYQRGPKWCGGRPYGAYRRYLFLSTTVLRGLARGECGGSRHHGFGCRVSTRVLPPLPFIPTLLGRGSRGGGPSYYPRPTARLFLLEHFHDSLFGFRVRPFWVVLRRAGCAFSISCFGRFPEFTSREVRFPSPFRFQGVFFCHVYPRIDGPLFLYTLALGYRVRRPIFVEFLLS